MNWVLSKMLWVGLIGIIAMPSFMTTAADGPAKLLPTGLYKGSLIRQDGKAIVFNFDVSYENKKPVIHIHNAGERLEVRQVKQTGDSVWIEMPFFESAFRLQLQADGALTGNWIKGTSGKTIVMPFVASPGAAPRFTGKADANAKLGGRWEMTFSKNGNSRPAIAELEQKGNIVTGSILTPTGDYRYLEGIVTGDSLFLSTFDGSHAYVFTAYVPNRNTIEGGSFYSGPVYREDFSARRNEQAILSMDEVAIKLKGTDDKLNFSFPDLEGKMVSINDARFQNKVLVIQIMGSWCPNCMDETAYLSQYYKKNRNRGVEMLALAYEYSTDSARSNRSLRKFQQRFAVDYPMLLTGVTSGDSLRTEKTLPQLTPIQSFPSTIFIGKDGRVKKIHGGFFGPATGEQYTQYVKEFEETVDQLLKG